MGNQDLGHLRAILVTALVQIMAIFIRIVRLETGLDWGLGLGLINIC